MALEPVDRTRCQCEITTRPSPFTMGGDLRPRTVRCEKAPVMVVSEIETDPQGERGAMSLCADCLAVFLRQSPPGRHTFDPITPE